MASGSSRRRVLAGLASTVAAGLGAGCTGADPPELRVRNYDDARRTLDVEVTRDDGETVHAAAYRLGPDEQAATQEIFDYAGTYVVTATADGGTTLAERTATDEIEVDDPNGTLTHVTVRDDGVSIGRTAP